MNGFFRSVKGKIIIASVLGCLALVLALLTSKNAFNAMLTSFEHVSAPNDKLRIINELSRSVLRYDQGQKVRDLRNPDRYKAFITDTKKLNEKIDTLRQLYVDKPTQVVRLNRLKLLLQERDRLFISYLKVREGLVNNKSFTSQVQSLNQIVNSKASQADSMVTSTERKTSTTTIYPKNTETAAHKGFFNRLFGKKNKEADDKVNVPYQVVNEEWRIKHDTITRAIKDSLVKELGETIQRMEAEQQGKSARFVNREATLIKSGDNVMHQIISILKQVETDGEAQTALNSKLAKNVVDSSIKQISLIMLCFFVVAVILLYFILTDISRINQYRREVEQAKEEAEYHSVAKQRFLSNMSHELRTPLQSIIGYAEKMQQQLRPQKSDVDAIYKSSGHLMQIVNEVLDYNRIISGKFTFENQVFNLHEVLDEVVSAMRLQAENKGLGLKTNYDSPVNSFIHGDPFRLKQILYNLLGNAVKFTNKGSVLLTATSNAAGKHIHYFFKVADTGIGLTQADTGLIFNEFEQAAQPGIAKRNGTGLGLPITKELVTGLGGTINVVSEPGKGSEFSFDIAYETAVKQTAEETVPHNNAAANSSDKVWMIDDDPFILELCSDVFQRHDVDHRCFNSPYDMLSAAWDERVKYLLLDIRMPEMNGIELCRLMRAKIPPEVKIYALTAQAMPEERTLILNSGFDGLLMKPFKQADLLHLVNAEIDEPDKKITEAVFDISGIEKMTFGDTEQTAKILNRFIADSLNDIALIKNALSMADAPAVALVAHRIAGRTAQVGAKALAGEFRMAEIALTRDEELTQSKSDHFLRLTEQLDGLINQARNYTLTNVPLA